MSDWPPQMIEQHVRDVEENGKVVSLNIKSEKLARKIGRLLHQIEERLRK